MYYALGVRYVSLTHDCHNMYADSAAKPPLHHGLTTAGRLLIHEMNRMGMLVDLSHASAETMRDALNISAAPVIASHSSVYSICPHYRNVPDDIMDMIKENGGILMISFYPSYTNCEDPRKADTAKVADHIEYAARRMGWAHVGVGADFDGMAEGVIGLEDVGKYPSLLDELLRRGVGTGDVSRLMGWNVVRVLEGAERVASEMSGEEPLEFCGEPYQND